ncbi:MULTISPECIES: precorrin-2 C(20)-methyltransferase [Cyanophyceae]|uniref:precorrin-2 C(20)-methyltransferase n=1 Tax=Cyanophyceae TaxID=3028117 RepID=UPI0016866DDF|nr:MULTISPECIES: precorrin-2 C(20)-methyltransferase [Cyanophyceae]MBD1917511.1 precorrin-2 C(20)-methyltransferase [Phormidium sp. FACHB-77]MBD2029614.1 precorrin-2 C(20)-methyltransferase [Phormidium sp. FACHB-322]MBD2050875.1 precorrin-2 C(20)-methyltransferase [Leptolyngbya sp. FACHB-60]
MASNPIHVSAPGTLTGIGVGPGDPDLITLKALKCLQTADVVAFPQGRSGRPGVAQTIIAPHLGQQQLLPLDFPYIFDSDQLTSAWQQAGDRVWQCLSQGQNVVFACEGDLSFYGTFNYLALSLERRYPAAQIKRIPGICSPMAAVSALGLPLTVQSDKLVVLPALYTVDELDAILAWADVVVLLKVGSVYNQIWQLLQQRYLLEHSWVIVNATQPTQMVYRPLTAYPCLELPYFSLMVIRSGANPLP